MDFPSEYWGFNTNIEILVLKANPNHNKSNGFENKMRNWQINYKFRIDSLLFTPEVNRLVHRIQGERLKLTISIKLIDSLLFTPEVSITTDLYTESKERD